MDLYLLVAIFLRVSLKDYRIRVAYIRPYNSSLGLIIIAFIITTLVEVSIGKVARGV